jgi:hypothetical protein
MPYGIQKLGEQICLHDPKSPTKSAFFKIEPSRMECYDGAESKTIRHGKGMKANLSQLLLALLILSSLRAVAVTRYVDLNSPSPTPPYLDWPTAATNIQDAIDVAVEGDLVLVTNGVYGQGGRVVFGAMTNRVAVTKRVTVQSVNGPTVTFIRGNNTLGDSAVRCAYLTNGAWLVGFSIANGATRSAGDEEREKSGGGVWCEPNSGVLATHAFVSNCVIAFNTASSQGGGGYGGEYRTCTVVTNSAIFGGGISRGALGSCLLAGNYAYNRGGGVYNSSSYGNSGNTVVGNFATVAGGGTYLVSMDNSIIYFNVGGNYEGGNFSYCCIVPKPGLGENITNAPIFIDQVAFDFRLHSNSPCINAGRNASVFSNAVDLAGNLRIAGGTVDIGAYELQSPSSLLSYAWAQQYGLPTDGSADFIDSDGDAMSNYGEWRSDTNPTNALSVLQMVSATNSATGTKVTWRSTYTRTYFLERSTNLLSDPPFLIIASNIIGAVGATTRTDAAATNGGPYFYRVGVQ